MEKMKVIWEMETGDPDDYLTLLFLIGHPKVDLIGVNVNPGSWDQVSVVKQAFKKFGVQNVPVGAHLDEDDTTSRVSGWHYKTVDLDRTRVAPDMNGAELLDSLYAEDVTLITGSPLKNVGKFLREFAPRKLGRIIVQGGFAGEGVVPSALQLEKFSGKTHVPTYNLNGDPKSALLVVDSPYFSEKKFVSKNVCHGVYFDDEIKRSMYSKLHKINKGHGRENLLLRRYLNTFVYNCRDGKKLHDPLAAACAIDTSVGTWAKVDLYRRKGQWGAILNPESKLEIIIDYDRPRFIEVLNGG
jgi:inosine-uridine nucleoside N-ribohydrolase